jgi:protease I
MSSMTPRLKARRVAILAADGFELVELVVPMLALRNAGAIVEVLSLRKGRIRGMNLHEPSRRVAVSRLVADAHPSDYDALLIPGGFISPDLLRQSQAARNFVRVFDTAGKPIATLCHGPWVLASAGLTEGRTMTSWPGIRDDLVNSGATWLDQELVRDANWVSSRGPQDLKAFVLGMLDLFSDGSATTAHAQRNDESSPQRDRPPQLAVSTMKWLPGPQVRLAAAVGLFGLWAWRKALVGVSDSR